MLWRALAYYFSGRMVTQRGHALLDLGTDIFAACFVSLRSLEKLSECSLGAVLGGLSVSCAALGYARCPSLGFDGALVGNPTIGTPPWPSAILPHSAPASGALTVRWGMKCIDFGDSLRLILSSVLEAAGQSTCFLSCRVMETARMLNWGSAQGSPASVLYYARCCGAALRYPPNPHAARRGWRMVGRWLRWAQGLG